MAEPADQRIKGTGRPSLTWVQKNGKWLGAVAVIGVAGFWMFTQVNPESVMEFRVNQAIEQTRTQVYRCLNNQMWSGLIDRVAIMECAE